MHNIQRSPKAWLGLLPSHLPITMANPIRTRTENEYMDKTTFACPALCNSLRCCSSVTHVVHHTDSTRPALQCPKMSVVMSHGKEEGKDGPHHQGDQLSFGKASLAFSTTMRVSMSHICHLKMREFNQRQATGFKTQNTGLTG